MSTKRICMWSGPRNVSTAIMYAFAQRSDTCVVDEPLYAHYLRVSGAQHPGRDEIIAAMNGNGTAVVRDVIWGPCDRDVLFIKNMTHHLVDLDHGFLSYLVNIFLIRDPIEMLPSLINQIPEPTLRDTALKTQVDLLHELRDLGQDPVVIDSKELLLHPNQILRRLCHHVELEFDEAMLSWPAGPLPEDGIWAKHWYHNVHKSTGFQKYRAKEEPFPDWLQPVLQECKPCYDELYSHALKANSVN
ncbi:sulfotransferase family protein [bacterium]|nr:sulfotransferase family protein [bacterium]